MCRDHVTPTWPSPHDQLVVLEILEYNNLLSFMNFFVLDDEDSQSNQRNVGSVDRLGQVLLSLSNLANVCFIIVPRIAHNNHIVTRQCLQHRRRSCAAQS